MNLSYEAWQDKINSIGILVFIKSFRKPMWDSMHCSKVDSVSIFVCLLLFQLQIIKKHINNFQIPTGVGTQQTYISLLCIEAVNLQNQFCIKTKVLEQTCISTASFTACWV